MSKKNKRRNKPAASLLPAGWCTSDADEIERHRMWGVNEAIRIESQMSKLLAGGGFTLEALAPMREAEDISLLAVILWQGHQIEIPPGLEIVDSVLVQPKLLSAETISHLGRLFAIPQAMDLFISDRCELFQRARADRY